MPVAAMNGLKIMPSWAAVEPPPQVSAWIERFCATVRSMKNGRSSVAVAASWAPLALTRFRGVRQSI
jgi:hypothetical protein